jgi:hypothetical protein
VGCLARHDYTISIFFLSRAEKDRKSKTLAASRCSPSRITFLVFFSLHPVHCLHEVYASHLLNGRDSSQRLGSSTRSRGPGSQSRKSRILALKAELHHATLKTALSPPVLSLRSPQASSPSVLSLRSPPTSSPPALSL